MASTTTNYNLPIVAAQDKATWLTTFNGAMNTIDSALKTVENSIPEEGPDYSGQIETINQTITKLQNDISAIKSALNKLVNVVIVDSSAGTGITAQQYSNLSTVSANVE